MFDEYFADLKPRPTTRYADFVVSDVGGGPSPDASTIIRRFKDEEFPQILVSVNMLDTGFDCPEVVNLVMARFTRSAVLYRQMRGRGTRKAPHIRKTDFTMFDFVGVTDFHGDDEGPIAGGAVREPGAPTYGPATPRTLLTLDVNDHIDPASRDWATLDENGRIVRTAEHEARSALLGLRFEAWLGEQPFDAGQARWAGLIGSRIRADAMTIDGFWDYDLDLHPFTGLGRLRSGGASLRGPRRARPSCSVPSTSRSSTTMGRVAARNGPATDPRQWRIDATHAAYPRASRRHRPHPQLPLRRRLPRSGPERGAAQLPLLLLHVRGGGRGPRPRRAPAPGRTPTRAPSTENGPSAIRETPARRARRQ